MPLFSYRQQNFMCTWWPQSFYHDVRSNSFNRPQSKFSCFVQKALSIKWKSSYAARILLKLLSKKFPTMDLCVIYCGQTRRTQRDGGYRPGERDFFSALTSCVNLTQQIILTSFAAHINS